MKQKTTMPLNRVDGRTRQIARGYAATFAAETILSDLRRYTEPSDIELNRVLRFCSRPPSTALYHVIRAEFWELYHAAKREGRIKS